VTKELDNRTPRGALRALADWLRGDTPPAGRRDPGGVPARGGPPPRVAHYTVTGQLGRGGMGIVYAARDERLGRDVALKTMTSLAGDESARRRFWREARAAASVSHPNVCPIYEILEEDGELYIVMELLAGESLAERLKGGALGVSEALPIGLQILAALSALHARGVIHRDLKPSNVFLTPHGVKLLDFGLARAGDPELTRSLDSVANLTATGLVLGTPRYMAPEQVTGDTVDARSDLFAMGAILFEMLAGRPAFPGRNVVEILHATLHDQPPALTGSPAVAAADRVIRRALAKRPADRPASSEAMAEELRGVERVVGDDTAVLACALTRLVVLPFRVLRADPETDFLAFSLPDAIATSLSGIGSLVVRSSAAAARFGGETPDLKALASESDVDRVVIGTLLRAGDQVRASVQLVEAPGGTLITSHTIQSPLGDLFRLQDDIARRVTEALSLPLSGGVPATPDVPHHAGAYEFYLRANELARDYDHLHEAREQYERCLELDPRFAPGWARLGRCHWVIAKYLGDAGDGAARTEAAYQQALQLSPRLTLTHKLYAHFESDTGHSRRALVRLLGEAGRHGNDPELFAGLVHACRYCGLYEQSIAAHEEARRLDPNVPTSVEQTLLMMGDVERLFAIARPRGAGSGDSGIRAIGLGLAGRREEALITLRELRQAPPIPAFRPWADYLLAWLERRPADMRAASSALLGWGSSPEGRPLRIMEDPEAIFQQGWLFSDVGEAETGIEHLRRSVARGYSVAPTLRDSPAFDALRADRGFAAVVAEAEAGRDEALSAFRAAGGERILGL